MATPAIGFTLIMRLEMPNTPRAFGMLASVIGDAGGVIAAVDMRAVTKTQIIRDVTVTVPSDQVATSVRQAVERLDGVRVVSVSDNTFLAHLGGKIVVEPKAPIKTRQDLSVVYTPGVARVSMAIAADPSKAFQLTIKRNTVAVVTDGTAVLGLGDIGPLAAAPVMEGKCALFKQFADIDAFPICLATKDVDDIVETVTRIAPIFGGINLGDIPAPRCFEVERRLIDELDIPVMHDDQHGTAVVILAALINAAGVVGKRLNEMTIVVAGSGAAGTATIKMLLAAGVRDVIPVDRGGALNRVDRYDNPHWTWLAEHANRDNRRGSLAEVLHGVDAFIGVSAPNILKPDDIKNMARDPIVFAMANPTPEIMPEAAAPYVAVMATGRSDFPNQINNILAFPGIFRGALDCRARKITDGMKLAAARALAGIVGEERSPEYIVPSVFDTRVVDAVAKAVVAAAVEGGVARRTLAVADSGAAGLETAASFKPEIVLLDVGLPDISGLDVCTTLANQSDAYILMVSAHSSEDDKLAGLGLGADDYITKPFSGNELVARVQAFIRRAERTKQRGSEGTLKIGDALLDHDHHTLSRDGKSVALTALEFRLLWCLGQSEGKLLTRAQILERVWNDVSGVPTRVVDVHVAALRKKLAEIGAPVAISSVRGIGYRLDTA